MKSSALLVRVPTAPFIVADAPSLDPVPAVPGSRAADMEPTRTKPVSCRNAIQPSGVQNGMDRCPAEE